MEIQGNIRYNISKKMVDIDFFEAPGKSETVKDNKNATFVNNNGWRRRLNEKICTNLRSDFGEISQIIQRTEAKWTR